MTSEEFRAALKDLGIRQRWLARKLGVNHNTVYRWAAGKMPVPQYAAFVIELLAAKKGD